MVVEVVSNQEESIEKKFRRLHGAPLFAYRFKWRRLIEELLNTYNVSDPQVLGLPYTLDDLEQIEKWVTNICHGLVESECFKRIEHEISKRAENFYWDRETEEMKQYIDDIEQKAREIKKWQRIFRLPVDIDEYTAEQLKELYEHPELNHDTVYNIIYNYIVNLGMPEQQADSIARKSAEALEKIVEAKNRHYAVAEWTQVLRYGITRVKKELERRKNKADEIVQKFIKAIEDHERIILSEYELKELYGYQVKKAESANVTEALNKLQVIYRAEQAIIGSPDVIYKFSDKPLFCLIKKLVMGSYQYRRVATIFEKCNQDVIIIKQKGQKVYYQYIQYKQGGESWNP